jgi:hypothetical protein
MGQTRMALRQVNFRTFYLDASENFFSVSSVYSCARSGDRHSIVDTLSCAGMKCVASEGSAFREKPAGQSQFWKDFLAEGK